MYMGIFSSLINAGVNSYGIASQERIANQNLEFQKQNLAYQKDLQSQIFQREDNAVQRRAADLEASGLSKTLAAGSAAGAGQAIQTTAPQKSDASARSLANFQTDIGVASEVIGLMTQSAEMKKAQSQALLAQHDADVITSSPFSSTNNTELAAIWRMLDNAGLNSEEWLQNAVNFFNTIGNPISELGSNLTDLLSSGLDKGSELIKNIFSSIGNNTVEAFQNIGNLIGEGFGKMSGSVSDFFRSLTSLFPKFTSEQEQGAIDKAKEIVENSSKNLDINSEELPFMFYLMLQNFKNRLK